eukprot:6064025-Amphidinium_carterae.2
MTGQGGRTFGGRELFRGRVQILYKLLGMLQDETLNEGIGGRGCHFLNLPHQHAATTALPLVQTKVVSQASESRCVHQPMHSKCTPTVDFYTLPFPQGILITATVMKSKSRFEIIEH